jgi:hypothetical protein
MAWAGARYGQGLGGLGDRLGDGHGLVLRPGLRGGDKDGLGLGGLGNGLADWREPGLGGEAVLVLGKGVGCVAGMGRGWTADGAGTRSCCQQR